MALRSIPYSVKLALQNSSFSKAMTDADLKSMETNSLAMFQVIYTCQLIPDLDLIN